MRPAPLRTDGSNAFANHSMAVRVPGIILDIIARNPDYPASVRDDLRRLHDEVAGNAPLRLFAPAAPDYDLWAPRFARHDGETWLGSEWFFCEMLVYRRMMEAARYFATLRDPFAPVKHEEMDAPALWTALDAALDLPGDLAGRLAARLSQTLWGNRIDLSLTDVAAKGTHAHADHLLADDLEAATALLLARPPGDVHVVMDNAGTEQALDYALADLLLDEDVACTVTLHVKMHPVLVSDVVVADVHALLRRMAARGGAPAALAARLQAHLHTGRLRVVPDFFWNMDGRLWELPPRLRLAFAGARLVLAKGDVNYRRATHDALWPPAASLADAVRDFPAPLLVLRTLKSDTLVGVDAARRAALDAADPDWRTNGSYGVIQLASFGAYKS